MKYKYIIWFSAMMVGLGLSSCKENLLEEITELNLDRALSPTELTAQVVDRTNVRLNWRRVSNADSYVIEIFDNAEFSGTATRSIEGVKFEELPYTVEGLFGETIYGVRVGAVGEGLGNSTWITTTFETGIEHIFNELDPETLTEESVTLSWPEGELVTSVVLMPGEIEHRVSSADAEAGTTTIVGLESDVTYTATLMNEDKRRGVMVFTTLLGGPGVTKVTTSDNLAAVIAAAADGAVFAIEPGTYVINDKIEINKNISVRGYKPHKKPVIQGAIFRVTKNAALTLRDLSLDGTGGGSDQTVVYNEDLDSPYGAFLMQNCEVKKYVKGIFYVNKKARIPSVTFTNNLIHDIECNEGDFIDFRKGIADEFIFVDNTVYNSAAARDLFRMDAGGSDNFGSVESKITISSNTFYKAVSNNGKRYLYIRLANHSISFTKNLIVESEGYYTNQGATTITELSGNNYHNAPNFTASTQSNAQNDSGNYTSLNPEFTDPENGDFTVNNLDLKLNGIGAARWR
ncbi:DUF4957 domain-containing protein [Sphingobacterium arenae]|uniref:DUF4957 domain-containing protein n=1 Tax=Sphingobacterium arenae TaxID=1280598 RepID=A0ABR7XYI0_9SPHI|nr:DUF4957 domain-containing protein [Sphingobacterium arenae]MBD1424099.1 DUF4957 domain-containing protein [Sphingobacterium arenae]